MHLVDSHCHIDFSEFDKDRTQVIERARAMGIKTLVVPGVKAKYWHRLHQLTFSYTNDVITAFGLHPLFIKEHQQDDLCLLEKELQQAKPWCRVGEIGLDFQANARCQQREKQIEFFHMQLLLAQDYRAPVILHVRKAHDTVLKMIKSTGFNQGGVVHAFNGTLEHAKHYIDKGFALGFGGLLTLPQSNKLKNKIKALSLSDVVLETDAPDMSTYGNRGNRNEPYFINEVAQYISKLKHVSLETVSETTTQTASRVLNFTL